MQGLYPIYKPRKNKEKRRMNDINRNIHLPPLQHFQYVVMRTKEYIFFM